MSSQQPVMDYRFKFLAWSDGQYMYGHHLLSYTQIKNTIPRLSKYNIFTTIQEYNKDGDIVCCPIYADLDGNQAQKDLLRILVVLTKHGITPQTFFSGNRGFHIVIPYKITHPLCHEVAGRFMSSLGDYPSLDRRVYNKKRLWRVIGSRHTSSGLFKVPLNLGQICASNGEIRDFARTKTYTIPPTKLNIPYLNDKITDIIKYIDSRPPPIEHADTTPDPYLVINYPCITKLLNTIPVQGERNTTLFVLARFFRSKGIDIDKAWSMLMTNGNFKGLERMIKSTLKSIYSYPNISKLGCKSDSSDAIFLRARCDNLCPMSDKLGDTVYDSIANIKTKASQTTQDNLPIHPSQTT